MSGIQGQMLEVTVVGCSRLRDTEWLSRQDPYVFIEYGSSKFRSRTCVDGGRNPTFQEKFIFNLIEGLREINVVVWNNNTFAYDNLIGSGKVQIQKVLSQGFDDTAWPIQSKSGRYAGEVRLIMHYSNANKPMTACAPSAPQYYAAPPPPPPPPQVPLYPPQPYMYAPYPPQGYTPQQPAAYPPQPSVYPPQPYPTQAYPPQPYPPPCTSCSSPNPYQTYRPPY